MLRQGSGRRRKFPAAAPAAGYNRRAVQVGEASPGRLPKAQTPVIAQARYHRRCQTLWRDRPPPRVAPAPKGHEVATSPVRLPKLSGKRTEGHPSRLPRGASRPCPEPPPCPRPRLPCATSSSTTL